MVRKVTPAEHGPPVWALRVGPALYRISLPPRQHLGFVGHTGRKANRPVWGWGLKYGDPLRGAYATMAYAVQGLQAAREK